MNATARPVVRTILFAAALVATTLVPSWNPVQAASSTVSEAWTATIAASMPTSVGALAAVGDGVVVGGRVDGVLDGQQAVGSPDAYLQRLSATGSVEWSLQFGTVAFDDLRASDSHGDALFVVGVTNGVFGTDEYRSYAEAFVAKVTLDGRFVWARQFAGEPADVAALPDGSVVAVGELVERGGSPRRAFVKRFLSDGTPSWTDLVAAHNTLRPVARAHATHVVTDASGLTVYGGVTGSVVPDLRHAYGDVWLRRYDFAGHALWTHQFDLHYTTPDHIDHEYRLTPTAVAEGGGVILAMGTSNRALVGPHTPKTYGHPFTRAFSLAGRPLWLQTTPAIAGDGDASGVIMTTISRETSDYASGTVIEMRADGSSTLLYRQEGSRDSGEWRYNDVALGSGMIFVARQKTLFDPMRDTYDLLALRYGDEPDRTPPDVAAPAVALIAGSRVASGQVDLRVSWSASDRQSGLYSYSVSRKTGGGSWSTFDVGGLNGAKSVDRTASSVAKAGRTYQFRARARDAAGNLADWTTADPVKVVAWQEGNKSIAYRGWWRSVSSSTYWYGWARTAVDTGASATLTFTGRGIGVVSRLVKDRGWAEIFIDGVKVDTIDLYAPVSTNQVIVWTQRWEESATHTITVRALLSGTRRRVDLDAFLIIQ